MPLSNDSRYFGLPVYDAADASGATRPTVALRPPTPPPPDATTYRHRVVGAETMEYLAWRYYGSSEGWWRLAEANPLAFPLDLRAGMTLDVPAPGDVGRVVRTRTF